MPFSLSYLPPLPPFPKTRYERSRSRDKYWDSYSDSRGDPFRSHDNSENELSSSNHRSRGAGKTRKDSDHNSKKQQDRSVDRRGEGEFMDYESEVGGDEISEDNPKTEDDHHLYL